MNIDLKVPCGVSNEWQIKEFIVTEKEAKFHNLQASFHPGARVINAGTYKNLYEIAFWL